MSFAPFVDTAVIHGDAELRVLLALRDADAAMVDADATLRGVLLRSAWSARGVRALNEQIAVIRVNLARDRMLLDEIRRTHRVG